MQKSNTSKAVNAHRRVGASTTLNRKYVRRPQENNSLISHFNDQPARATRTIQIQDDEDRRAEAEAAELAREQDLAQAIEQQVERQKQVLQAQQQEFQMQQRQEFQAKQQQVAERQRTIQVQEAAQAQQRGQMAQQIQNEQVAAQVQHPVQVAARKKMWQQRQPARKLSAKQIKDQEIKKALATTSKKIDKEVAEREKTQKRAKLHFGIARVMLAISCTAAAVMAIMYFVNTNMPDISMRVTALQTGINATYPGYVPRGYNMTTLSSEQGRITMQFESKENDDDFTLVEENSSWDSNALLTNYVKPEMGENYTIVREQGLTIYTTDKAAAWVNGGVVYKLDSKSGQLTKKQIKSIAVSM